MNNAMNRVAQCIEYHLQDKFGIISQITWSHNMGEDNYLSLSCNRTLATYSDEQSNSHPFLLAEIVLSPRLMLPDDDIQMNAILRTLDDMIKRVKNDAIKT